MSCLHNLVKSVNTVGIPFVQLQIKQKLDCSVRRTVVVSAINLAVFSGGFLLVVFVPFGNTVSFLCAAVIFLLCLVWSVFRLIKNCRTALPIIRQIVRRKSVRCGVAGYIREKYPAVQVGESVLWVGALFSKELRKFPTLEDLIHQYIQTFFRFLVIYAAVMAVYCLLINFILKPLLLRQFADTSMFEIYLFPFIGIWRTLVHGNPPPMVVG